MPLTSMGSKLCSSLLIIVLQVSCQQPHPQVKYLKGFALGTSYNIQYDGNASEEEIQNGIDALFYELNRSLSTYLPQSDISKINRGDTTVVVDHHFKAVFEKATEVWKATGGYFDPTVGALVNAYGFGPENAISVIEASQKDSLLRLTGWEKVTLTEQNTILKEYPEIYIDFNALAKGYVVDVIGNFLHKNNSTNYMVEIGGEIVAKGISPKTQQPWKIAIDDPREESQSRFIKTLSLEDQALASSGNYRKYRMDPNTGERYVHSINPITGSAYKSNILSTSVKAPNCMTADAWATALMVMPIEEGRDLVEEIPHIEALWATAEGNDFSILTSKNW